VPASTKNMNLFFSYQTVPHYRFNEDTNRLAVHLRFHVLISVGEENPEVEIFHMQCGYVLGYEFNASGGPSPNERDYYFVPFAKINGLFNVWPFFRELVHSTTMRMGIPPMLLPALRIQSDGILNQREGESIPGSHVPLVHQTNAVARPGRRLKKRRPVR
jgi:hypothetical protein